MARTLKTIPNVLPEDSEFPFGRVRNNSGLNDGTRLNEETTGDWFQYWAKIMQESGLVANGLPDSDYTGYQLVEASCRMFRKYGEILHFNHTTAYQISTARRSPLVVVNSAWGPTGSISLPDMLANDDEYNFSTVTVVNKSSGNSININGISSAQTIDGASVAFTLDPLHSVEFCWDADQSNWIVSKNIIN